MIQEPKDQQGHLKRRGSRGGRPVDLATRYDKHAIVDRAAVLIHATIAWTQELSDTPEARGVSGRAREVA